MTVRQAELRGLREVMCITVARDPPGRDGPDDLPGCSRGRSQAESMQDDGQQERGRKRELYIKTLGFRQRNFVSVWRNRRHLIDTSVKRRHVRLTHIERWCWGGRWRERG